MADINRLRQEKNLKKDLGYLFDIALVEIIRRLFSDDRQKSEYEIDMALTAMTGASFLKLYTDAIMSRAITSAQGGSNSAIFQAKQSGNSLPEASSKETQDRRS